MRRTQIYLTEEEWKRLAIVSRERHLTKAFLIREAVDQAYLARPSQESFSKALWAAHGLWKDRKDIKDPAAYVRSLRKKGDRDHYLLKLWRKSSLTQTS